MTKRAKVLLIAPFPLDEQRLREDAPLGLAYIASALENSMHEVEIFDMGIESNDVMQQIETFQPSIVGIQVLTQHRFFAFELARKIKGGFPSISIVLGGPHVTFTADEVLKATGSVDTVVRGEGEITMCELASGAELASIHGISFRKEGGIVHNPSRPFADLNDLAMPAYHLLKLRKYKLSLRGEPAIPIFTSRGCPNRCVFCSASHMWKHPRNKEADKVIQMIKTIRDKFGYNAFVIEDDTFGANIGIAREILDGIKRLDIRIGVKTRVEFLNREFLRLLKEAGCVKVNFGVESGEPRILKVIKKNVNLSDVVEAVEYCRKLNIVPGVYFMAGNITESKEDVITSIKLANKLDKLGASIIWAWGVLIFPGTELDSMAREYGILPKDFSWVEPCSCERNKLLGYSPYTPVLENTDLKIEDLVELKKEYYKTVKRRIINALDYIGVRIIPERMRQLDITHKIREKAIALLRWL